MIEFRYRIVDVFSDRPLAGNALCVVLDPCPDVVQQAIAREVNLSETTFPVVTGAAAYEMRIFTPQAELAFAGHPSLGTAWVLGPGRWTQTTSGATVVVEADAHGAVMAQPDPVFTPADPAGLAPALGRPGGLADALGFFGGDGAGEEVVVAAAGGVRHLLVATEAPIEGLVPNQAWIAGVTHRAGATTLCVVRRRDDRTLHVRVFAPTAGIAEDPGTGSAAGPIATFARRRWGTDADVTILQGAEIGRPCLIEVHAEEGAVRVGGRVTACAEGRFTL